MSDRGGNLLAGALATLMGVIAAAAIYLRPEGLRVPAFVAYAATAAFILVGFVIFAMETRRRRLYRWMIVALLLAMFTPGAWIAFGPGERACTVSASIVYFEASGVACRAAFGLGAIILAVMLHIAIRDARSKRDDE